MPEFLQCVHHIRFDDGEATETQRPQTDCCREHRLQLVRSGGQQALQRRDDKNQTGKCDDRQNQHRNIGE